jgi:hypothetical protein
VNCGLPLQQLSTKLGTHLKNEEGRSSKAENFGFKMYRNREACIANGRFCTREVTLNHLKDYHAVTVRRVINSKEWSASSPGHFTPVHDSRL